MFKPFQAPAYKSPFDFGGGNPEHMVNGLPNVGQPKQGVPIGIHGPWHLSSGSPMYPNHHPYLTHIQPPSMLAPTPSAKIKMPS